jgi:hypothetical protein
MCVVCRGLKRCLGVEAFLQCYVNGRLVCYRLCERAIGVIRDVTDRGSVNIATVSHQRMAAHEVAVPRIRMDCSLSMSCAQITANHLVGGC